MITRTEAMNAAETAMNSHGLSMTVILFLGLFRTLVAVEDKLGIDMRHAEAVIGHARRSKRKYQKKN